MPDVVKAAEGRWKEYVLKRLDDLEARLKEIEKALKSESVK